MIIIFIYIATILAGFEIMFSHLVYDVCYFHRGICLEAIDIEIH